MPKAVGHPTVITLEVQKKLEDIFKVGGTIAEATAYAGIGERTYYDRAKANEEFSQKMSRARHYADVEAKNIVVKKITKDKDLDTAKWWLEKREFRSGDSSVAVQVNIPTFNVMSEEAKEQLEKLYEGSNSTNS